MNEITRVLAGLQRGDSSADPQLLTLVYAEPHQLAELVKLRYVAGLSIDEAADVPGIFAPTAKRDSTYARGWLAGANRFPPAAKSVLIAGV